MREFTNGDDEMGRRTLRDERDVSRSSGQPAMRIAAYCRRSVSSLLPGAGAKYGVPESELFEN